jgi:hypothetical protein
MSFAIEKNQRINFERQLINPFVREISSNKHSKVGFSAWLFFAINLI